MAYTPPDEEYSTPQGLTVRRLQPAIGALISGADLRRPLSQPVFQDVKSALLAHGVIFFRDQDISYERHVALGEMFGELVRDHGSNPERPEILPVKSAAGAKDQSQDRWHSDGCYMAIPPAVSILRAIQAHSFGGDTCFASGVAAYAGLSDEMKARIADLRFESDMAQLLRRGAKRALAVGAEEMWRELERKYPAVDHPVVRAHPETGQPVLFISENQATGIVGMEKAEGRELIRTLADEIKRPEYQLRWNWRPHSIAIWDNRAVQHYAVPDPQLDRYMERVTVVSGGRPLGLKEWELAGGKPATAANSESRPAEAVG
jgi:taurine dioxygenase